MPERTVELTEKQRLAWRYLFDPDITEVMFGGGKGGAKSFFGCVYCFEYVSQIIKRFGLTPCESPPAVGWMGRKQATDFTGTTLQTWREVIPADLYTVRAGTERDSRAIVIGGSAVIHYGGLDKQESINKFNSAEYGFIFIDQAEETTLDDVAVLRASRRKKINGVALPFKGLYTANPADCWLKNEFILNPRPDQRFVRALWSDNPHLPSSYLKTLEDSFRHRPELLKAYRDGDWDAISGAELVIKEAWIAKCRSLQFHTLRPRKFLVCDPARFGDDETVIYGFKDTQISYEEIFGQKDTMYTANRLHILARQIGATHIGVDVIGLGGGIVDRLRELARRGDGSREYEVVDINSSERSSEPDRYYNIRAEVWDTAARMLEAGDVSFNHSDVYLTGQLCSPKYEYRNGRILVEAKEKIKDRINRSPDRADAYVMGLWMHRKVVPDSRDSARGIEINPLDIARLPPGSIGKVLGMDKVFGPKPIEAKAFTV